MKSAMEILARAVILTGVSDRCAMEITTWSPPLPHQERDQQRLLIWEWLNEKGYSDFITNKEKDFFLSKIGRGFSSPYVQTFQCQSEAVALLLWTLGLVNKLPDYRDWSLTDYHPLLQITPAPGNTSIYKDSTHIMGEVLDKCELRDEEEVLLRSKMAILWHWRALNYRAPVFKSSPVKEVAAQVFGKEYEKPTSIILKNSGLGEDFAVNKRIIDNLNGKEIILLRAIARWRCHAFQWIFADEQWDKLVIKTPSVKGLLKSAIDEMIIHLHRY
jgi:hypothetical protein